MTTMNEYLEKKHYDVDIYSLEQLEELKQYNKILSINFNYKFNQEIKENVLPQSLTRLTFGIVLTK